MDKAGVCTQASSSRALTLALTTWGAHGLSGALSMEGGGTQNPGAYGGCWDAQQGGGGKKAGLSRHFADYPSRHPGGCTASLIVCKDGHSSNVPREDVEVELLPHLSRGDIEVTMLQNSCHNNVP